MAEQRLGAAGQAPGGAGPAAGGAGGAGPAAGGAGGAGTWVDEWKQRGGEAAMDQMSVGDQRSVVLHEFSPRI